eukprot:5652192-Prymnesium_polylepis.1
MARAVDEQHRARARHSTRTKHVRGKERAETAQKPASTLARVRRTPGLWNLRECAASSCRVPPCVGQRTASCRVPRSCRLLPCSSLLSRSCRGLLPCLPAASAACLWP